jgi:hypothetical protein
MESEISSLILSKDFTSVNYLQMEDWFLFTLLHCDTIFTQDETISATDLTNEHTVIRIGDYNNFKCYQIKSLPLWINNHSPCDLNKEMLLEGINNLFKMISYILQGISSGALKWNSQILVHQEPNRCFTIPCWMLRDAMKIYKSDNSSIFFNLLQYALLVRKWKIVKINLRHLDTEKDLKKSERVCFMNLNKHAQGVKLYQLTTWCTYIDSLYNLHIYSQSLNQNKIYVGKRGKVHTFDNVYGPCYHLAWLSHHKLRSGMMQWYNTSWGAKSTLPFISAFDLPQSYNLQIPERFKSDYLLYQGTHCALDISFSINVSESSSLKTYKSTGFMTSGTTLKTFFGNPVVKFSSVITKVFLKWCEKENLCPPKSGVRYRHFCEKMANVVRSHYELSLVYGQTRYREKDVKLFNKYLAYCENVARTKVLKVEKETIKVETNFSKEVSDIRDKLKTMQASRGQLNEEVKAVNRFKLEDPALPQFKPTQSKSAKDYKIRQELDKSIFKKKTLKIGDLTSMEAKIAVMHLEALKEFTTPRGQKELRRSLDWFEGNRVRGDRVCTFYHPSVLLNLSDSIVKLNDRINFLCKLEKLKDFTEEYRKQEEERATLDLRINKLKGICSDLRRSNKPKKFKLNVMNKYGVLEEVSPDEVEDIVVERFCSVTTKLPDTVEVKGKKLDLIKFTKLLPKYNKMKSNKDKVQHLYEYSSGLYRKCKVLMSLFVGDIKDVLRCHPLGARIAQSHTRSKKYLRKKVTTISLVEEDEKLSEIYEELDDLQTQCYWLRKNVIGINANYEHLERMTRKS